MKVKILTFIWPWLGLGYSATLPGRFIFFEDKEENVIQLGWLVGTPFKCVSRYISSTPNILPFLWMTRIKSRSRNGHASQSALKPTNLAFESQ